jgi:hypothetical protein
LSGASAFEIFQPEINGEYSFVVTFNLTSVKGAGLQISNEREGLKIWDLSFSSPGLINITIIYDVNHFAKFRGGVPYKLAFKSIPYACPSDRVRPYYADRFSIAQSF